MLSKTRLFRQFPFRDGVTRMDTTLETDRYTQKNMYALYIKEGDLYLARCPFDKLMEKYPQWEELALIAANVAECAIAFDGFWQRENDTKDFYFQSTDLWLFWVSQHAELKTARWDGTLVTPETLLPGTETGVSSLSAIRGWKSVTRPQDDDGMIIAYIYQGELRYRARCEQESGQIIWEPERTVAEAPFPIQKVRLFRGNDYRTGFMVEQNGVMYTLIGSRTWAGMGNPPEIISAPRHDMHANTQGRLMKATAQIPEQRLNLSRS